MPKEWFRMKLNKAYTYLLSLLSLTIMFIACYYLSYQHALNEFNKNAVERNDAYAALEDNIEPTSVPVVQDTESEAVDVQAAVIILPATKYILEEYDMKTKTLSTTELNPPGYLVGLTREEVIQYLSDYMNDLTLSEYNKGLVSFELLTFSDKEVVLRKNYDVDRVPFRFYVIVKNGYVVVYNSDLKSIFSYTHIEAIKLPEEDRIALSKGIYVNSLDELYALLESYTS